MKASIVLLLTLCCLAAACANVAANSSQPQTGKDAAKVMAKPGIKTVSSSHDFQETVYRVQAAIKKRPLTLFDRIDHAAGAAKADLSLPPSTLFIFGNPKGGTPLMQRNPQMGIVLPLKMHIYQDGNTVKVSYTDIVAQAGAYGLDSTKLPIPKIAQMLEGLAAEVTGN